MDYNSSCNLIALRDAKPKRTNNCPQSENRGSESPTLRSNQLANLNQHSKDDPSIDSIKNFASKETNVLRGTANVKERSWFQKGSLAERQLDPESCWRYSLVDNSARVLLLTPIVRIVISNPIINDNAWQSFAVFLC